MKLQLHSLFVLLTVALVVPVIACDDDNGGSSGEAKVGNSCSKSEGEGLGINGCDGQDILSCSSLSDFKWTKGITCPENETCTVAADMKSASCEAASSTAADYGTGDTGHVTLPAGE